MVSLLNVGDVGFYLGHSDIDSTILSEHILRAWVLRIDPLLRRCEFV